MQRAEKETTKPIRRQTENISNIQTSHTGGSQEEKVDQGSQQAVYQGQRKQQSFSSSPPAALLEADKPTPGTTQSTTLPAHWHMLRVPRVKTHHHKPRPSNASDLLSAPNTPLLPCCAASATSGSQIPFFFFLH